MASPRARRLRNMLLALATLGFGLWMSGTALWQLGSTAMFVHESVVVTGTVVDVRQKPFERWSETLGKGNWSWPGDVSYQPLVHFVLPSGIHASHNHLDADNEDYSTGQPISIISPPDQPGKARINRWKFLWGADCMRLGAGALLIILGYGMLRRLRGKKTTTSPPATPRRKPASSKQASARQEETAPAKSTRKRSSSSGTAPRRRQKANHAPEATSPTTASPKPRRSRKKKAEEQTPELPF